jgi:hypothetical protein
MLGTSPRRLSMTRSPGGMAPAPHMALVVPSVGSARSTFGRLWTELQAKWPIISPLGLTSIIGGSGWQSDLRRADDWLREQGR